MVECSWGVSGLGRGVVGGGCELSCSCVSRLGGSCKVDRLGLLGSACPVVVLVGVVACVSISACCAVGRGCAHPRASLTRRGWGLFSRRGREGRVVCGRSGGWWVLTTEGSGWCVLLVRCLLVEVVGSRSVGCVCQG